MYTCSTISELDNCDKNFICVPVAQKVHALVHPTWDETQTVYLTPDFAPTSQLSVLRLEISCRIITVSMNLSLPLIALGS